MGSQSCSSPALTIVLACFQGSAYVTEQIESIQAQTHRNWRLLVRDDGSDDATIERIQKKAAQDPRIELLEDGNGRLGVIGNFSHTLEIAMQRGAAWMALCDQDDRWLPNKLEIQLERLASSTHRPDQPVLLHCDAAIVGRHLEPIHPSLHRFMGLRHEVRNPLATLLVQNFVTGCTCIVNRPLLELALPIPEDCVMYDWWLALCAASTGAIDFEPEPLVQYRQHDSNAVGARSLRGTLRGIFRDALSLKSRDPAEFIDTLRQATMLEQRLLVRAAGPSLSSQNSESIALVRDYLDLFRSNANPIRRMSYLHQHGIRRQNPILDLTLKLRLLTGRIEWLE